MIFKRTKLINKLKQIIGHDSQPRDMIDVKMFVLLSPRLQSFSALFNFHEFCDVINTRGFFSS